MMPVRQVKFRGAKQVNSEVPKIRASQPQGKDDAHVNDEWESTEGIVMMSSDQEVVVTQKKSSASIVLDSKKPTIKVNFRKMVNPNVIENSDFELPFAVVQAVQHKYENSLVMSDDDGMFYFKFSSLQGLEQVLEKGPWLIRNVPLILTKWSPNMTLSKDEVTRVPVWVKMHKVPVVAYTADGLSLIATQIGNPLGLDAFTCKIDCHVFGHTLDHCPKKITVKPTSPVVVSEDGFTTVVNRKSKGKGPATNSKNHAGGFKVNNTKNFQYQPVKSKVNDSSASGFKANEKEKLQEGENNGVKLKNLFEKLNDITSIVDPNSDTGDTCMTSIPTTHYNDDSESEVEEVFVEENPKNLKPQGASTPFTETPHV
ncbi:retrovirus-related pol polyprotein from transposon TNT 1-94 [Tanacetum coccineum]